MKGLTALLLLIASVLSGTAAFAQNKPAAEKWKPFKNIEIWEYCLTLPLDGYVQDYKQSDVKAKHVFTHRHKKKSGITVWALDSAYSKATPEAYFKRYYAGAEEKGQILEERKLDANGRRFYGWGYWSNSIHESRFLEIVWLRDNEVIKINATFPVADTALWKARLPRLLEQSTVCKPD